MAMSMMVCLKVWPILLAAIVGCSGDVAPTLDWGALSCHPKDEVESAEPGYAVVVVGATVEFTVSSGAQKYSWRRCDPSGACIELPDVTGPSYTWAGLNLADDGSRVEVTRYDCAVTGRASVPVEVLPGPGWVFEDGEFMAGDWETQVVDEAGGPTVVVAARMTTGGNPGAYLDLRYDLPPKTYSLVFHGASRATYDPATQGEIHRVDFSAQGSSVLLQSALRQGGRLYAVTWPMPYAPPTQWPPAFSRTSWDMWHFQHVAGPPCGSSERCPDFSTQGSPITFGFIAMLSSYEYPLRFQQAIDNWRVTVWRR